ncbi:zinc finger protein 501-like [Sinocyclocheilus grahami]|uniref:zinc finger protein 501-like n=1 Tax=Sinocyclocheilus grahami TaxID=75366 RepID=UPI0007AD4912|nr:PREDICTED: zinc finger protein 501-like [Sinocyclocheilus grahami]
MKFNPVAGEEKEETVTEGDSPTLRSGLIETNANEMIEWCYKAEDNRIAEINGGTRRPSTFAGADVRFRSKLMLDDRTGDLTISNVRTIHSGLYKLNIISSSRSRSTIKTKHKRFNLTVNVKEGVSVLLQTVAEIQTDDRILLTEFIEESEDNEELSEDEKDHVKTGEKPLSCSQTKHKDLKKRAKKSFTCTQCGKSLTSKHNLDKHMNSHTGEKPYKCSHCDKRISQSGNLKIHERIHTGEKPYTCDQCGKSFTQSSQLKRHRRVHTKEKQHSCYLCGKSFSRFSTLKEHQKMHTAVREYMCFECEKTFTLASRLKQHERIHSGEKPYKCSHCDKRFIQSSNLKTHERIHTGEKPFPCTQCGKSFTNKQHRVDHMRVHTGEKLFTCDQCGKSFTVKSHLKIHMRIHAVEKPDHRSLKSRADLIVVKTLLSRSGRFAVDLGPRITLPINER